MVIAHLDFRLSVEQHRARYPFHYPFFFQWKLVFPVNFLFTKFPPTSIPEQIWGIRSIFGRWTLLLFDYAQVSHSCIQLLAELGQVGGWEDRTVQQCEWHLRACIRSIICLSVSCAKSFPKPKMESSLSSDDSNSLEFQMGPVLTSSLFRTSWTWSGRTTSWWSF